MSLEISMKLGRNRAGTTRMGTSGAWSTTSLTRTELYKHSCEAKIPSALQQNNANFGLVVYPQSPPNGVGCLLRSLYLGHYACFVEGRHLVVAFDSHVLNRRGISEFLIVSILALLLNILPSFRSHRLPSFVSLESRGHSLPLRPLFIQLHDNVKWFERSPIVQIMLQSWTKDTTCGLGVNVLFLTTGAKQGGITCILDT
ncbi:hypothetical protein BDN70DRAFT_894929 [Pholiota conissans]|uniref:Uncharacterized protein n=1 Tax=Pholiota conissans TaxID=109636 RepID=A0A9P5Z270_9AGAR|nr:hypothetical protein BDN70DRAFT_894929 [Pholiota conissans]